MNIALLLEMAASGLGDRCAVVCGDVRLGFGELQQRAFACARHLLARPGRTVAYAGLNSPAFPVALFAAAIAGRAFAPLNYRLPDAELRRLLARTAPSLAIVDDAMLDRVAGIEGVEMLPASTVLALSADHTAPEPAAESDIAVLLFTSGTTGEPKAGILRHRHLSAYVISTVDFMGSDEAEAALVSVPPYHIAGISAVLTSIYGGRRLVQLPAFAPEDWVEAALRENITHAMVVPTMLGRILDQLQRRALTLPALRHLSYGGGRMPEAVIRRAMEVLPRVDFVNAYGLTETSSTVAMLGPEEHRLAATSDDPRWQRRLGSVGRPLPTLEVEIRDPAGVALPAGATGEIWVRGDQVSGEYVGRRSLSDDGWYPTRDAGWMDDDGFLFVDGRLDDVIVRGGENISPGEIEDLLRAHPAVADVAVIGLPDNEWGERVAAVAVTRRTVSVEELQDWVKCRLRSTRVPQEIVFRDALPYNETGKLLRRALRQELATGAVSDAVP